MKKQKFTTPRNKSSQLINDLVSECFAEYEKAVLSDKVRMAWVRRKAREKEAKRSKSKDIIKKGSPNTKVGR